MELDDCIWQPTAVRVSGQPATLTFNDLARNKATQIHVRHPRTWSTEKVAKVVALFYKQQGWEHRTKISLLRAGETFHQFAIKEESTDEALVS
jgi:hypothetical protein